MTQLNPELFTEEELDRVVRAMWGVGDESLEEVLNSIDLSEEDRRGILSMAQGEES